MKLELFRDCLELLFPSSCPSCKNISLKNEPLVCLKCQSDMPKQKQNSIINHNGKNYNVYSSYKFHRKGRVQKLIHGFKYNNHKEIGEFFAEKMSTQLHQIENARYIIPVPIHWKKKKIRGYNQSYVMAKKIAELNNMKVLDNVLYRVDESKSQTKKSRYNRFSQIEDAFRVNKGFNLDNEHLILIDDIVTTGATISACIQQLESFKNIKLSILCIAN